MPAWRGKRAQIAHKNRALEAHCDVVRTHLNHANVPVTDLFKKNGTVLPEQTFKHNELHPESLLSRELLLQPALGSGKRRKSTIASLW